MLKLTLYHEGNKVKEINITAPEFTVGREGSCDLALDDRTVSRRHARVSVTEEGVYLEDLESRNGTYVSGRRVGKHKLSPGETASIGSFRLEFEGVPIPSGKTDHLERREAPAATAIISSLDARKISTGEDVKEGAVAPEAMMKRLSALYDLGQKLAGRLAISEISDSFLDVIFDVFAKADRAVILLEDSQTRKLVPVAAKDKGTGQSETRVSTTVIGTVLNDKNAVICGDTSSDARFKDSASLQDLRIKSIMCVPLMVSDKVLGMVEVDSSAGGITFAEDDLRLLTGLASQVSIALDNGKLYDEVERSKRLAAIGQTVSGVAHCVKNVLNGIDGGLFIARRGLEAKSDEKVSKGWEMLERNSSFLKGLVLDMLDYSKARPPEYQEMALKEIFDEIMAFVEGRAAEGEIALVLGIDPEIGPVRLDPTRMKRALLNIVGNAVEATPQGGKVELSAVRVPPGEVLISIADTGKGIPEDMIDTIFEPFVSTKGSKGTGLGLPVMKKIVEEHGGRVELESIVGQGTTFKITIPIGARDVTERRPVGE
ncbi:MAG: ATP-binding protein [Candidatus Eisenbacteria bacterium]